MGPLNFAVAGGGIAGLAAAVALGRSGFEVAIFERRPALDDLGAGLQLSPNATRVARSLGLLDRLEACASEPRALRVRRGGDGRGIAVIPLGAVAQQRYGAPMLVLHRADLMQVLSTAVEELDSVTLSPGTRLETFDPGSGTGTVAGPLGSRQVTATGLIRADGVRGDNAGRSVRYSGKTAWRALIPGELLPSAFREPETNLWLGEDAHIVHYPIRGGSLVNVVVIVDEARGESLGIADFWAEPGDPAVLQHRLRHWNGQARQLIDAHDQWRKWPLFDGEAGSPWSTGRETRIGDAAHPMLPFLAQGASQAFEDAAALAAALTAAGGDVSAAFSVFEARRRPVAERVQAASRRQGRVYHLNGAAAAARDLVMRLLGPERLLARMDWLYGPVAR